MNKTLRDFINEAFLRHKFGMIDNDKKLFVCNDGVLLIRSIECVTINTRDGRALKIHYGYLNKELCTYEIDVETKYITNTCIHNIDYRLYEYVPDTKQWDTLIDLYDKVTEKRKSFEKQIKHIQDNITK